MIPGTFPTKIRQNKQYRLMVWLVLISSLVILWFLAKEVLIAPQRIMGQDFAQIWAAGRLNTRGLNPYDPLLIQKLKEQISGRAEQTPQIITVLYSPPWTMLLVMPFGILPYLHARILWLIGSIVLLFLCAKLLCEVYRVPKDYSWVAWLTVFTFAPTYLVLSQGQITPLVLFGVAGFLSLVEDQRNDWVAGVCATLISIKPQLFYLFWFALLMWIITRKRWKLLASMIITVCGAMLIGMVLNPGLLTNYLGLFTSYSPIAWITPTFGLVLRLLFGVEKFWLQYIPMALGLIWFVRHWKRNQASWNWSKETPVLIFVSIITTPYAWTYDQILILVALIAGWSALIENKSSQLIIIFGGLYIVINLVYTLLHHFITDEYFLWLAPALFLWWWLIPQLTKIRPETARII